MKLACAKLVLVDEFLTYKAFGCSAVNEGRHRRAFHGGVVGEGNSQGVLSGKEYIVWE